MSVVYQSEANSQGLLRVTLAYNKIKIGGSSAFLPSFLGSVFYEDS
jgi:hypothetical protein